MESDKQILEKLSRGDISAFDSLYIKYNHKVRAFALQLTKNQQEAEDITHNIFLKIWNDRAKADQIDSFKSYLFVMTKNAIFNLFRRSKPTRLDDIDIKEHVNNENIEECVSAKDLEMIIAITIDNMPTQRREIFKMSRYDKLSYEEIAERLKISKKTVQYHISNALSELKKLITSFFFTL